MSSKRPQSPGERKQLEIFRRMTPAERIECCFRWTNLTYEIARSAIRGRHPEWTPIHVDREIGRRITGIDVEQLLRQRTAQIEAAQTDDDRDSGETPNRGRNSNMSIPDEFAFAIRALEATRIPYVITGSLASVAWGKPRATYDANIVIALRQQQIDTLLHAFPSPAWYLNRGMIVEALRSGGEFNAIHAATGTKLEFWVKGDSPADDARFLRRRRETLGDVSCWILSPEDTILAKLE